MPDAVCDAIHDLDKPSGLSDGEWAVVKNQRQAEIQSVIADRWMEYSEYLDVEFDTEEGTAVVLPRGSIQ
jgi:hypothetical protein